MTTIETETAWQNYVIIKGLLDERESQETYESGLTETIDDVLEQLVGTGAADALLSDWGRDHDELEVCEECGAVRKDLTAHTNWCKENRDWGRGEA